jgi:hypothetical protein
MVVLGRGKYDRDWAREMAMRHIGHVTNSSGVRPLLTTYSLLRARVATCEIRQILTIFMCLQTLDVLTTIVGLNLGAQEGNFFVAQLLRCGTVPGLICAKVIACLLAGAALLRNRQRLLRLVNFWFAAVVGWNLLIIALLQVKSGIR